MHNTDKHNRIIKTTDIIDATTILCSFPTKIELTIAEALLIKSHSPSINNQREGETRVLNIF